MNILCHAKPKYMENAIVIAPNTQEIGVVAKSLQLKNELLAMGFVNRTAFVEIVCDHLPEYSTPKGIKDLQHWWAIRKKDEQINRDLQRVIETLRHE